MKKIFLLFCFLLMTSVYAGSFSARNLYVSGFGGLNVIEEDGLDTDLASNYAIGAAVGYKFSRFFRVEVEGAYRSNFNNQEILLLLVTDSAIEDLVITSRHTQQTSAIFNALLDIPLFKNFVIPYCGIGLGSTYRVEQTTCVPATNVETTRGIQWTGYDFAFQSIVGISLPIRNKIYGSIEYHYLAVGDCITNHTIGLNIKRYF